MTLEQEIGVLEDRLWQSLHTAYLGFIILGIGIIFRELEVETLIVWTVSIIGFIISITGLIRERGSRKSLKALREIRSNRLP